MSKDLDFFQAGPTETFVGPTGNQYTIRERNGEDEEILSRVKDNQDGSSLEKFVSAILVNPKLSHTEVRQLPIKDKYYIILKSRIQSLGNILATEHTFTNSDKAYPFQVDLNEYLSDFTLPQPKPGTAGYSKLRCTPYPAGINDSPFFEKTLSSGKKVRMMYLTGVGESKVLSRNFGDLTINERLRIRNFQFFYKEAWQEMENFKLFTAREMTEIRMAVDEFDSAFDLNAEFVNPANGEIETISLLRTNDFFFPMTL